MDKLFWLSFADDEKFRGVCLVIASDLSGAIRRATALSANPGGQVFGLEYPPTERGYETAYANRDRLIGPDELKRLFPDTVSVAVSAGHVDENKETIS